MVCQGCNERYEGINHHCDEAKINRIEAARTADRKERSVYYSNKLGDGFYLWKGSEC